MAEQQYNSGKRDDDQPHDTRSHILRPGEQTDIDLPPMQQVVLDAETLASLVRDLNECAQIDDVLLKSDSPTMIEPADRQRVQLDDAILRLQRGEVRGVQVRYRYDGHAWSDTLMHGTDGVRLTRIQDLSHP